MRPSNYRVRKYAKFGIFYARIVQMTPQVTEGVTSTPEIFGNKQGALRLQKFQ